MQWFMKNTEWSCHSTLLSHKMILHLWELRFSIHEVEKWTRTAGKASTVQAEKNRHSSWKIKCLKQVSKQANQRPFWHSWTWKTLSRLCIRIQHTQRKRLVTLFLVKHRIRKDTRCNSGLQWIDWTAFHRNSFREYVWCLEPCQKQFWFCMKWLWIVSGHEEGWIACHWWHRRREGHRMVVRTVVSCRQLPIWKQSSDYCHKQSIASGPREDTQTANRFASRWNVQISEIQRRRQASWKASAFLNFYFLFFLLWKTYWRQCWKF